MGFIEAQQELTVLTIVIPILYVALYTSVNAALQLSFGLVVVGGALVQEEATKTLPAQTYRFCMFFWWCFELFIILTFPINDYYGGIGSGSGKRYVVDDDN